MFVETNAPTSALYSIFKIVDSVNKNATSLGIEVNNTAEM